VWGLGVSVLTLLLVVIGLWRRRPKKEQNLLAFTAVPI
jgi:hypothetical protein